MLLAVTLSGWPATVERSLRMIGKIPKPPFRIKVMKFIASYLLYISVLCPNRIMPSFRHLVSRMRTTKGLQA